ncbi:MAG: hypothetical protein JHC33_07320 [Ignisphaera sp.]|nr:hypothetical protein [Ignisphaera sp.]
MATTRLKNITLGSVSLQMFTIPYPVVGDLDQNPTLFLTPGEDVDEALWLVEDNTDTSYNAAIIDNYIKNNILTRILLP